MRKDLEGASRTSPWEYRSIIGLINYISDLFRPHIAYATHSAARFSSNPKASHDKRVKSIIKYLKGTKENGLIMYPKIIKDTNALLTRILREDGL